MRILFITAFYPPHVIGGWEQLVQDIRQRLAGRGHQTRVLTSDYGVARGEAGGEPGVDRRLSLDADLVRYRPLDFFLARPRQLERNLALTRQAIQDFQPDVVFIHVMWNLARGVAWQAEQLCPGRVVYYLANDWPYAPDPHRVYWQSGRRGRWGQVGQAPRRLLAGLALRALDEERQAYPLRFERVLCVSQAIQRELLAGLKEGAGAISPAQTHVVYNGVETERFYPAPDRADPAPGRLAGLYAGSLAPHKGVHTALEALARLADGPGSGITLTLVGAGHPDYEARLRALAADRRLNGRVTFLPRVDREAMPDLMRRFDALVFPSTWQEPLARVMQEAMATGLVVVGTLTGGSPEILSEGETGLTFAAGDAAGLARQLERLSRDPALRRRLAAAGRRRVVERFDLERMITAIERHLQAAVEKGRRQVAEF